MKASTQAEAGFVSSFGPWIAGGGGNFSLLFLEFLVIRSCSPICWIPDSPSAMAAMAPFPEVVVWERDGLMG